MPDYGKVDKIEFIYEGTDLDGDFLHFTFVLGSNRIPLLYYDWEDEIPSFAVLYDKVSHHEDYSLCLEKDSARCFTFRVKNLENDIVSLYVDIGSSAVCEFKRKALLKMLRKPLLKAAKDKDYLFLKFNPEDWNLKNDPADATEYNAYIEMLEQQIVPNSIWKVTQDYNLYNPNNIFNRH